MLASHGDCWTAQDVATSFKSTFNDNTECWDSNTALCGPLSDTSSNADSQLQDLGGNSNHQSKGVPLQAPCRASLCDACAGT